MQIKSGFEQAAYALLLLHRCGNEQTMPLEQLSSRMQVSASYLQKLMRKLVQADLVASVPGAKGGFRLNPNQREITLYDIYTAMEGKRPLFSPNGVFRHAFPEEEPEKCILSEVMEEAEISWIQQLQSHTVAGLDARLQQKKETV